MKSKVTRKPNLWRERRKFGSRNTVCEPSGDDSAIISTPFSKKPIIRNSSRLNLDYRSELTLVKTLLLSSKCCLVTGTLLQCYFLTSKHRPVIFVLAIYIYVSTQGVLTPKLGRLRSRYGMRKHATANLSIDNGKILGNATSIHLLFF